MRCGALLRAEPRRLRVARYARATLRQGSARAQEDRQWALMRGLEEINKEIEAASRSGVACWFPMGTRDERIVRLAAREATLLNSRCAAARRPRRRARAPATLPASPHICRRLRQRQAASGMPWCCCPLACAYNMSQRATSAWSGAQVARSRGPARRRARPRRDKAPFMLFVEVLSAATESEAAAAAAAADGGAADGAGVGAAAEAPDPERRGSHAAAGPGAPAQHVGQCVRLPRACMRCTWRGWCMTAHVCRPGRTVQVPQGCQGGWCAGRTWQAGRGRRARALEA